MSAEPPFEPGLALGDALYREVLRPLIDDELPGLVHSAALIGPGSDVLGFDTPRSRDHDWGPRAQVFLSETDLCEHGARLRDVFRTRLPASFLGYSMHYSDPCDEGTRVPAAGHAGAVDSLVEVTCIADFTDRVIGHRDATRLDALDWLAIPEQSLRELTSGAVFHDGLGELAPVRESLRAYPRDVWLYRMAAQWHRIGEEEPFIGRARELGDARGGRVVVARVVREVMRLAFLIERVYAPYAKWLGTAFARLPCAASLGPPLDRALSAADLRSAACAIGDALECAARRHSELGIGEPLDPTLHRLHDRPYDVIGAERFSSVLRGEIEDDDLVRVPIELGAVDQLCDASGALASPPLMRSLGDIYAAALRGRV